MLQVHVQYTGLVFLELTFSYPGTTAEVRVGPITKTCRGPLARDTDAFKLWCWEEF